MLAFLRKKPAPSHTAGVLADGKRIYAIGDVHGRADLLALLLQKLQDDAQGFTGEITLVFIGDLIDRGPDSAGVLALARTAVPAHWRKVMLMGNHEQAILDFLDTPETRSQWLSWGGDAVLPNYGVPMLDSMGKRRNFSALASELEIAMEETGDLAFIQGFVLSYLEDGYAFVHAGVRPNLPFSRQIESDFLFIRDEFVNGPHGLPYKIVYGHTITPRPTLTEDRVGLDTGAFQSGILTAAALEKDSVRILQAELPA